MAVILTNDKIHKIVMNVNAPQITAVDFKKAVIFFLCFVVWTTPKAVRPLAQQKAKQS